MNVVEVLRAARALVARPDGWAQGDGYKDPPAGKNCVVTATATADPGMETAADDFIARALGLKSDLYLSSWNDAPGRTQAEVVEAFDRAIALAEAANG